MVWVPEDVNEAAAILSMRNDLDRAVGIVAASILESRLERAMRGKLRNGTPKLEERADSLFRPSGPMGPFSTKIDIGLLLGLYSEEVWRELVTIKDIRNVFAHKIGVSSFDDAPVRDLASNLIIWENYVTESEHVKPSKRNFITMIKRNIEDARKSKRGRYLVASAYFTHVLRFGSRFRNT